MTLVGKHIGKRSSDHPVEGRLVVVHPSSFRPERDARTHSGPTTKAPNNNSALNGFMADRNVCLLVLQVSLTLTVSSCQRIEKVYYLRLNSVL